MMEQPSYDTLKAYLWRACYDDTWEDGFAAVEGISLGQYGVTGFGIERSDSNRNRVWCLVFACEDDDETKPETVISIDCDDLPAMHTDIAKIMLSDFEREPNAISANSARNLEREG